MGVFRGAGGSVGKIRVGVKLGGIGWSDASRERRTRAQKFRRAHYENC